LSKPHLKCTSWPGDTYGPGRARDQLVQIDPSFHDSGRRWRWRAAPAAKVRETYSAREMPIIQHNCVSVADAILNRTLPASWRVGCDRRDDSQLSGGLGAATISDASDAEFRVRG
jgi:hypothetical protein